ncbi:hypothetical protein QBC41DRAFT_301697 [Cercophora samala]|uniref:DUF7707 domain-containing protein n=1 Tax=Cercophora samala TaxID=330535 RepID=A0AA39ZFX5_9PEZI|nr:hypothetical protein QBC41DRAFT_301697 [Cercophora samala]
MFLSHVTSLLALASGTMALLPYPENVEWEKQMRLRGYGCMAPLTRVKGDANAPAYYGKTLCPLQIKTCAALCSSLGGAIPNENDCQNDHDGEDDPDLYINYCYKCHCWEGDVPNFDVHYEGTIWRFACEREAEDCRERKRQYELAGEKVRGMDCVCPYEILPVDAPALTTYTTTGVAVRTTGVVGFYEEEEGTSTSAAGVGGLQRTTTTTATRSDGASLPEETDSGAGRGAAGVLGAVMAVVMVV